MKRIVTLWAIAMLVACALLLLKCAEKTEKAPVKNPTKERRWINTDSDDAQEVNTPRDTTVQPPD